VQIVLDGWKWVPRPSLCEGGSLVETGSLTLPLCSVSTRKRIR